MTIDRCLARLALCAALAAPTLAVAQSQGGGEIADPDFGGRYFGTADSDITSTLESEGYRVNGVTNEGGAFFYEIERDGVTWKVEVNRLEGTVYGVERQDPVETDDDADEDTPEAEDSTTDG